MIPGFTTRYAVTRLVYCAHFDLLMDARAHERRLKRWHRKWKIDLIERDDPDRRDLYDDVSL